MTETVTIARPGAIGSSHVFKAEGRVSEWSPDIAGWCYRIQRDHRGLPFVIHGEAALCLVWPDSHAAPVFARLAYLLPSMMERASEASSH